MDIIGQRNRLQYIILGLLSQQDQTGYDLTKAFEHEIGEFWQASHSQIYPQLQRLETAGDITHQDQIAGEKLAKKVYQLTAQGQKKLAAWVGEPSPELTATKDEFILKLYFIKSANDPRLGPMLQEQTQLHAEQLTHLQSRRAEVFPNQAAIDAAYGHYLILEHAIEREKHYVEWLNRAQ
ncbi:transcriptional regulator [Levilactobacillus acidifarinae DSM 19394]|uniref:Transcriptional regulator n=1 Tax=Levilactobacillus acidifarinae DSM 19394 = JCM 15949 TaxID=1423715 RepID=A0A0R1LT57_9LACO|nr:transcriptional regulator [Levilactobacillus acidifarinae DSM 19394]GEO69297.1 PadR family transcriptional regulator [Levilactobacillus acidifarinae]